MDTTTIARTGAVRWAAAAVLAVTGALAGGSAMAQATTAVGSALVGPTTSSLTVPVDGAVKFSGDTLTISGNLRVSTTAVPDFDFRGPPMVVITIEFLDLAGVTATKTVGFRTTGTIQKTRPLAATDTVEVTFPVVPVVGDKVKNTRVARAVVVLNYDASSGVLTTAQGTIGANRF